MTEENKTEEELVQPVEKVQHYYAEIDSDNICCSLLNTTGVVESATMIELDSYNTSVLGKKYNSETESWEEVEREEIIPEPTTEELLEENQVIIMEALATQFEEMQDMHVETADAQATIFETLVELQEV